MLGVCVVANAAVTAGVFALIVVFVNVAVLYRDAKKMPCVIANAVIIANDSAVIVAQNKCSMSLPSPMPMPSSVCHSPCLSYFSVNEINLPLPKPIFRHAPTPVS